MCHMSIKSGSVEKNESRCEYTGPLTVTVQRGTVKVSRACHSENLCSSVGIVLIFCSIRLGVKLHRPFGRPLFGPVQLMF